MTTSSNEKISSLRFIGPRSENRPFIAEALSLILNDHVYWRRNFHPKDPPVLRYSDLKNDVNTKFQESLTNELFKLMAELKFDPPFFSPRYMAHMISEPLLPGLIAYIATLFYNPNNVASEASTATREYEIEVGKQLSKMFNLNTKQTFAHLTGGGTLANYQSLYYNTHLRFIPVYIFIAIRATGLSPEGINLPKDLRKLCNIPYERYEDLLEKAKRYTEEQANTPLNLDKYSLANLGWRGFERKVYEVFGSPLPDIKIIVPASAHYSWSRGAKLIGLGTNSLIKVKLNNGYQLDIGDLKSKIAALRKQNAIILQTVAIYGTTELGSFDPIDELLREREIANDNGMYFPIHIDAAYGGYFSSLFQSDSPKRMPNALTSLKNQHQALKHCESITVDPHKLGYAPYGAGAFLFKHGELKELIAENAEYCFNPKGGNMSTSQLGKYILEGSKPGAAAAAVYFNHKLVPLNYNGYGKMLECLCDASNYFWKKLQTVNNKSKFFTIRTLESPQSNIVCFFIVPEKNKSISNTNALTKEVAKRFGIKDVNGIQDYDYIVSNTTLNLDHFKKVPSALKDLKRDEAEIAMVRMVFMNQWHMQNIENGNSHIDLFTDKLCQFIVDYIKHLN